MRMHPTSPQTGSADAKPGPAMHGSGGAAGLGAPLQTEAHLEARVAPGAAAGPCLALPTWRDGAAASGMTKEQRDRRPRVFNFLQQWFSWHLVFFVWV